MNRKSRSVVVEPVFQVRFTLFLLMIVIIAQLLFFATCYVEIISPASHFLQKHGSVMQARSESMSRLVELASDESLPFAQKAGLLREEARHAAIYTRQEAGYLRSAHMIVARRFPYMAGFGMGILVALGWGCFWSRRFVGAEMGITRRLEEMIDGDLRPEIVLRKFDELHYLRRGIRRLMEEMRSIVRTDRQLTTEVVETVEQVCHWVASEENTSPAARGRLAAAAEKMHELDRLFSRYRLS